MSVELGQRHAARLAASDRRRFFASSLTEEGRRPLWMRATAIVMAGVMYFAPEVFLADEVAHAAPIVDPRAPVPFQPTVSQSAGGVPVINVVTPNAQGLSANHFQSLSAGPEGLIFNNSLTAGTSLIGGQVGANPNLAGRSASTILAQVTSTGAQYASVIAGPLEVFGNTAALIIANPNGISVPGGTALTNVSNLTLTTGVPQFLTGVGGTPTDYAHAGALAYDVQSGHIQIEGAPGANGPGPGIDGTVGNIDVIAQTIGINAPLRADQRVNLIAGNQLVSPTVADATGTTYATASNGLPNNAATIQTPNGLAIDASNFGSVTSGQIFIVATAAGMGVNQQGALAATAGNVNVTSNGDITVGSTFANQNVSLASVGNTTITDTGLANQNYTVSANGDITASGSVSAGQDASLISGGNLSATSVAATGDVTLNAGNSMTVGSVSGQNLALQTATGDLTVNSAVTAPGVIQAQAGRDLTVNGAVQGGSTVALTGARNATVNGPVAAVGDTGLTASTGTLTTTGNVVTLGALTAAGQQGVTLGGTVYSQGDAMIASSAGNVAVGGSLSTPGQIVITAGQDALVAGQVHSGQSSTITAARDVALNGGLEVDGTGNATVNAGRDLTGSGAVSVANDTTLTAGRNLSMTGAIQTGNNLSATAAQNLSVGATTAVGAERLTATNGSATLGGNALSGGDLNVTAGTDVSAQGSVQTLGNLGINAQGGNLTASAPVLAAGNATLRAGQTLALNAQITVSGDATLTGTDITTQGLAVGGNLTATATDSLDTSAGQLNAAFDANAPALSVNGNATLSAANVTTANAAIGGAYSATATTSLTTGGTAAYQGNATLAGGTVTNVGTQEAAGNLTVSGSTVTNQGTLSSLQTATVNATDLNNSGSIYGPTNTLTVSGSTTNTGALLATNALTLTSASLDNSNGLIFAGDVNNPASPVGDVTVNVSGGNGSFTNTNGQILAQNSLTVNLPNQTIDPSAATTGTLNGGSAFNLSAQGISNSGAWTLPGTAVTVTAGSISNSGTINQGTGTLALNGAVTNSGSVTANDLTINGSLANQAGATVQANDAFTLNGSGMNAGTVEAVNTLNISGSSYDNSSGTTMAGNASSPAGAGNVNINLTGDLTNAGGTLTATSDLAIQAANVINSSAGNGATTTTTTTVDNPALALAMVVGSETIDVATLLGPAGLGECCRVASFGNSVTLADALSPAGIVDANSVAAQIEALDFGADTLAGSPASTSGNTVTFVEIPTVTGSDNNGNPITQNLWFVQTSANAGMGIATMTLALPTATETTTTTGGAPGASSVIAAGHNVSITANSLNNQGGTVSAGNDANVNVQSLSNGGSSYTSTVTDTVSMAALNSFLTQAPSTISIWNSFYGTPGPSGCPNWIGACIDPSGIQLGAPGTVTPLSTSSSVTVQGATGQIVAGHNLNLTGTGGDLTNAGTLAAGNDVTVTASSFTNQGTNTGTMTTTAGCAAGFTGCSPGVTTNPNSQTYAYQQINSNVTAGHDIVIAANTVNNTYGNLAAGRNVVIGGTGTTASDASTTPTNLTQAASVTNTSGAIAAGNDVDINAATLTNTIAAPVQVHQNYGSATPFTGCSSNCEAYVDVQSAAPATITATNNVNLTAGSFSNTGSLVTALNNVTINATGSVSNADQILNAYWSSGFTRYGVSYATWGCANDPALCQTLYGSDYSSSAPQDPAGSPSSVNMPGFVPASIEARNTLSVNSPTLTNTGAISGQTVGLTGSQLVNGLTNPNVYTPPPAVSGQVISLGPPSVPGSATTTVNSAGLVTTLGGQPTSVTGAAGLPSNTPIGVQTVGKPVTPAVQTIAGQTSSPTYLVNSPASLVTGDLSPAALLAALPASLQPATTQFYYDPYTQAQQVEQAALIATGNSSFYSTTSATDSTSQTSINNQDTQALYGAALQYAEQNNVALGTQLSAAQLALVNAPMLWYVEETVPEPGCTATGNGACPTVQALMPEVLLPQNYAEVNADGTISGTNVALNYSNSILNTGSISASGTLSVDTGTLTNEERSTNVGTIYNQLSNGVEVTTGTVVQQGGFLSAANYDLNADAISQIGGAIQQVNADGSVNQAATSQLLSNLKSQLGSNFTQSTVSNDLNTTFIADPSGGWQAEVFELVAVAMVSVMTAGAGAALVGATAGTVEAGVANAAVTAMANSITTDAFNGSFSLAGLAESMAVAMVTAGATNGITYNGTTGSFGVANWDTPVDSGFSTLGQLAGVAPAIGSSTVSTAASTLANLPTQALAIAAEA